MRSMTIRTATCKSLLALAAAVLLSGAAAGQLSASLSDAQVQGNVIKALAGAPQLAGEHIVTTTMQGAVTLSGSVKDESMRVLAETLASRAAGVTKVVDELTLSTTPGSSAQSTNPTLQSDGTYSQQAAQAPLQHAPDPDSYAAQHGITADPQASAQDGGPGSSQPGYRQPYDEKSGAPISRQGGDMQPQPPNPQGQFGRRYPQGQRPYPPNGYRDEQNVPPPYGAQVAGQPVTVPTGSLLRVRINEGLDSKHAQPGTAFDAVVLNDVVADGAVAIPRGASVQGTVVEAKSGGVLSGHGEISLKLTQVTLSGKTFPLASDVWKRDGDGKGLQTVNNAVGLGAAGAIIGAIAGGGAGAAIGAGVGGVAGLGTSAASGSRQVIIPSEAILTFHLAQPAPLTTISQAEMDRLSNGVPIGAQQPPIMRRRYAPPVYYGPVYYPRPYPYPYPY